MTDELPPFFAPRVRKANRYVVNNAFMQSMTKKEHGDMRVLILDKALAIREDFVENAWIVYAEEGTPLDEALGRIQRRMETRNE